MVRPIPIDKNAVKRITKTLLYEYSLVLYNLSPKKAIHRVAYPEKVFKFRGLNNSRKSVTVYMEPSRKSIGVKVFQEAEYLEEAKAITVFVRNDLTVGDVREYLCNRYGDAYETLYLAILHELTHASDPQGWFYTEDDDDMHEYRNLPNEIRASMQEIAHQSEIYFELHTDADLEEQLDSAMFWEAIRSSASWQECHAFWDSSVRKLVLSGVYQYLVDLQVLGRKKLFERKLP